jgi:GDP-L-fucose synthase
MLQDKVIVTGGAGFLGQSVVKKLLEAGFDPTKIVIPRKADIDLTKEANVIKLYEDHQPDIVVHLAAEVGGIGANMENPGRFFYANMSMGLNLVEQARVHNIKKFVFVGTACAYPKFCPSPFKEEDLWNGYPEETNAPYGVAKKAIYLMLEAYQQQYGLKSAVLIPVNLYGPNDNFNPASSHVVPALIRKCVAAKNNKEPFIECWGTGSATRDFLYVDDAANGIIEAVLKIDSPIPINLGSGSEIRIKDLIDKIVKYCEYDGEVRWNSSKPDGQPRRLLDISKAKELLGWEPKQNFDDGLRQTVEWYKNNIENCR